MTLSPSPHWLVSLLFAVAALTARADIPYHEVVDVSATVSDTVPRVTLNWTIPNNALSRISAADDPTRVDATTARTYLPVASTIYSVIWDGARYIAVGTQGNIGTSVDGVVWTKQNSGTTEHLQSIARDATSGLLVVVGENGSILTSLDGISWTLRVSGTAQRLERVAHNGANIWVAVGAQGSAVRSTDGGVTWTPVSTGTDTHWHGLAFGSNMFVAVGDNGIVRTSPDGVSWTARSTGVVAALRDVVWNGAQFVSVGAAEKNGTQTLASVATSSNGITWTKRTGASFRSNHFVAWNGSLFVAGGDYSSYVETSPDGVTWTLRPINFFASMRTAAWSGSNWLVMGDGGGVAASPSGTAGWTSLASLVPSQLAAMASNGSRTVAVGAGGMILSSEDMLFWTPRVSNTMAGLLSVVWTGSQFVAVGEGGSVVRSSDGIDWIANTPVPGFAPRAVLYDSSMLVAVGDAGAIQTSVDGVTWIPRTSGVAEHLYAITKSANLYIACGAGGKILTSPDAVSWTAQTSGTTNDLHGVAWNGNVYVVVGKNATIRTSTDAITWTAATPASLTSSLVGLTMDDGIFYAVEATYNLQRSIDNGQTWTSHYTGLAQNRGVLVLDGVAYASGVHGNAPSVSTFSTRRGHQVRRRIKGEKNWGEIVQLPSNATTYSDSTAQAGVTYEYQVGRYYIYDSNSWKYSEAMGYVMVPVKPPLQEDRGRVILIVDQTLVPALAAELAQYQRDLAADGWEVVRHDVPRRVVPAADTAAASWSSRRAEIDGVRSILRAAWLADPARTKAAMLIGSIPVPYAGNANFDGHSNHTGAMPADMFYADVLGEWTDDLTDTRINTSDLTVDTRHLNLPGDGKLDTASRVNGVLLLATVGQQSAPPFPMQLQVGRIDFSNMTVFPSPQMTETELIRRYLRKAHEYRYKSGRYAQLRDRALLNNTWGFNGIGTNILRGAVASFGNGAIEEWPSGSWAAQNASGSFTFGDFGGAGGPTVIGNVGNANDFGRIPNNSVFASAYGSYFFDFEYPNNAMRALLASTEDSLSLTSVWMSDEGLQIATMGAGETVGYGWLAQMNAGYRGQAMGAFEQPGGSTSPVGLYANFHGDPTLRLFYYEPASNLRATPTPSGMQLDWDASAANGVIGYHVYRATNSAGPFVRISGTQPTVVNPSGSPLTSTTFVDGTSAPGNSFTYMVRPIRLQTTGSGQYYNPGSGTMVTTTHTAGALANPGQVSATALSSNKILISWSDNSTTETGFEIQRRLPGNSWNTVGMAPANATSYEDAGPIAIGSSLEYRVRAVGTVASTWSETAFAFALPSTLTLLGHLTYADINDGSVSVPVARPFGSLGTVSIDYATQNFSALEGSDYSSQVGTLTWMENDNAVKNITIPLLHRNGEPFLPRSFHLSISNPTGSAIVGAFPAMNIVMKNAAKPVLGYFEDFGEIGTVQYEGSANEDAGTFGSSINTLSLGTGSDHGRVFYREVVGDAVMTTRVVENSPLVPPVSGSAAWAGIDVRSGLQNNAVHFGIFLRTATGSNGNGARAEAIVRTNSSGTNNSNTITPQATGNPVAPYWLRVSRVGNTFTAQTSPDGNAWTTVLTQTLSNLPASAAWSLLHASDVTFGRPISTAAVTIPSLRTAGFSNTSLLQPDRPTQFTAAVSGSDIQLGWNDNTIGENSYRVEGRRSTEAHWMTLALLPANSTTFTHSNAAVGDTWHYRVSPVYAANALNTARILFRDAILTSQSNPIVWQCYRRNIAELRTNLQRSSGQTSGPMWSWNDGSPRVNVVAETQNQTLNANAMGNFRFLIFRDDFPLPAASFPRESLMFGIDYRDVDSSTAPIRFAIRVGSQWFATDTTYTPPAGTASSGFTRFVLDLASSPLWRSVSFTPGSSLALGSVATPPAGDITAFGWMGDDNFLSAGVTWDNFTVAMPEPLFSMASANATLLGGYQSWAHSHGLPTNGTGLGAPTAMPASDGIPNLIKYALGLNPNVSGYNGRLSQTLVHQNGEDYLAITYSRPDPAPEGIGYAGQLSSSADAESWSSNDVVVQSSVAANGLRTITLRDTIPINSQPRRFIRLRITTTP